MKTLCPEYPRLKRTMFAWAVGAALLARAAAGLPGGDAESYQTAAQAEASRKAALAAGSAEPTNLALIRELQSWRNRALDAEGRLASPSGSVSRSAVAVDNAPFRTSSVSGSKFKVLATMDAERVILVSCGRSAGVYEGALISVGTGVKAKVVEARASVSAAVVENGYVGKIASLDGQSAQLVLVR